jgi:hypothetical protein
LLASRNTDTLEHPRPLKKSLCSATYLRDSFMPKAIATDSSGNIYLAGNAIVDPSTSQTTVLVVKLNAQARQSLYLRYLGGGSVGRVAGPPGPLSAAVMQVTDNGVSSPPRQFPVTSANPGLFVNILPTTRRR